MSNIANASGDISHVNIVANGNAVLMSNIANASGDIVEVSPGA